MVKRYEFDDESAQYGADSCCSFAKNAVDGDYVLYDDYAELRALCEAQHKKLAKWQETETSTGSYMCRYCSGWNGQHYEHCIIAKYDQWRRDNED